MTEPKFYRVVVPLDDAQGNASLQRTSQECAAYYARYNRAQFVMPEKYQIVIGIFTLRAGIQSETLASHLRAAYSLYGGLRVDPWDKCLELKENSSNYHTSDVLMRLWIRNPDPRYSSLSLLCLHEDLFALVYHFGGRMDTTFFTPYASIGQVHSASHPIGYFVTKDLICPFIVNPMNFVLETIN